MCDEVSDKVDEMEVTATKFKPEHTSTQQNNTQTSTTVDPSATVSFAPYTLPSLKTLEPEEGQERTQPYHLDRPGDDIFSEGGTITKVKKEEPEVDTNQRNDLKFDEWWKEEEDLGRKRVRDEETSPQNEESKKIKTNRTGNENFINENSQDIHSGVGIKRKMPKSDESIFALPPRARQREVSTVHCYLLQALRVQMKNKTFFLMEVKK